MSKFYAFDILPDLNVKQIRVEADTNATFIKAGALQLNAVTAKTTYSGDRLQFTANVKDEKRELDASGELILHTDHQEVRLPQLAVRTQGIEWKSVPGSEATIQYGQSRVQVDDLRLSSGDQALTGKKIEELSSHKREIAGDHNGPVCCARSERSVKSTERAPLRIDIRDAWKSGTLPADERYRLRYLRQSFCNALGKRLAFNQQLRLIGSHSSGCAAGEDKGFHIGRDYPVNLENPEILYENAEILYLGRRRLLMIRFTRFLVFTAILITFASTFANAQTPSPKAPELFPLEDLRPGMKGTARTVFAGSDTQEFGVEVLGVLPGFPGPRQSAIIARLSGSNVEKTGVFAGMSGSPVYIDGKIVGAIAFSFPFSKEPIAGITPIKQMIDLFNKGSENLKGK